MAYARPTESAVSFEDTIPSKFSGWHYCTWTLADLRRVAGAVGLFVSDDIEKRDLYQLIVELRPKPSSLTSGETRAIRGIKGVRLVSKAATQNNTSTVRSRNGVKALTIQLARSDDHPRDTQSHPGSGDRVAIIPSKRQLPRHPSKRQLPRYTSKRQLPRHSSNAARRPAPIRRVASSSRRTVAAMM